MDESLKEKLRAMGFVGGADINTSPQQQASFGKDIAEFINGKEHETIFGKTFFTDTYSGIDYQHGIIKLDLSCEMDMLLRWANLLDPSKYLIRDFVFLDTETSGLSGGAGTFAFMVGLGYFGDNGFRVIQLFLRDPGLEPAFLASLTHFVSNFKGFVTFNGKSFDAPLLNGRYVINGMSSPLFSMAHIDLLPLSRRIWRNRLDDRSLKNLETQILGFHRSQDEVPGWMIPEIYYDYLKTKETSSLKGVFYHNYIDIVTLAALFEHLSDLLKQPLQRPETDSLDLIAIAKLYEQMEEYSSAIKIYQRALDQGLPDSFYAQTIMRYAEIFRRQQDWSATIALYKQAAEHKHIRACVELSKYYEHTEKIYPVALQWVILALEFLESSDVSEYERNNFQQDIPKRIERLRKKLACV